ncbi:hypothetical protein ACFLTP_05465 [Chloroflexota bacterium]
MIASYEQGEERLCSLKYCLVAGTGFEQTASGLWVQRLRGLLVIGSNKNENDLVEGRTEGAKEIATTKSQQI